MKPPVVDPPVVKPEQDEVSFTIAAEKETTATNKLGSVSFPEGFFAKDDDQGKLAIKKDGDIYTVAVTSSSKLESGKAAKVSLNYTPSSDMQDQNCIVVKDGSGNIIPNGRYENGKLAFYTEDFGTFTVSYDEKAFTDLNNHSWAKDAITRLAARGIINGTSASTFAPGKNITRAEFTTLIVRTFGFEGEKASFADVPSSAYYAEAVGIAKSLGIVNGVTENSFAPESEISREDMMVIMARALEQAGIELSGSAQAGFTDEALSLIHI